MTVSYDNDSNYYMQNSYAFRTPCSDAIFIQNNFHCYDIFKKKFVDLDLNKKHITFIKDY